MRRPWRGRRNLWAGIGAVAGGSVRSMARRLERVAQQLPAPRLVCRAFFADGTPVFGGEPVGTPHRPQAGRLGKQRRDPGCDITYVCQFDETDTCVP